ncbi:YbaB/EbfC family nucleoid-associated protein [Saccharopolyspora sp. HNM0983]|uniref:YbaB/EbfC family nucleoid-associated protein n=1 Tax=Saccharopolyspora montiporae TaxID=2781240 RepID=A0A929BCF5_9PSEU|nr:YbaB/EbfC family nucleoid-associated protein [Saccharopolyspora sp. HNM0983]MBE9374967.1 YbaB/EbfC family nucleoid-associated protein [Saccharopolyspora sp. HNM0983]
MTDLDQLNQKLESLKEAGRRVEQQMSGLGEMKEQLGGIEVRTASDDRSITVVAGPGGVTDIQLNQDALRRSPSQLSGAIMTTLREAVAEAARQQADVVQEFLPDSDVRERVLRTQQEMQDPTSTSTRTAPPPVVDDLDDEMPDSFLDGGRDR